jgi:hypothetical protein
MAELPDDLKITLKPRESCWKKTADPKIKQEFLKKLGNLQDDDRTKKNLYRCAVTCEICGHRAAEGKYTAQLSWASLFKHNVEAHNAAPSLLFYTYVMIPEERNQETIDKTVAEYRSAVKFK